MPTKLNPAHDLHESCEPEEFPEASASHQHEHHDDVNAVNDDDDVDEDELLLQAFERPAPSDEPAPLPMRHRKKKPSGGGGGGAKPKAKKSGPAPALVPLRAAAPDDDDDEVVEDVPPPAANDDPDPRPPIPVTAPTPWTNENAGDPPPWATELPQPIHDELALIVAVYPESTVYPVTIGAAAAATHAEEAAAAANYCVCGDDDAMDMTAMLSHVARLSLRIDGENVTVVLSALVPRGFGAIHGCNPSFEVRSPNASRTVVSSVEETLAEEVAEQCGGGSFSFLTFVGRASELVAGIPLGLQSDMFGFCLTCAAQSAKRAKLDRQRLLAAGIDPATVPTSSSNRKYPQPLRVISGGDGGTSAVAENTDESAAMAAVRRETAAKNNQCSDAPAYQCLACQSTTHVVRIPSLEANVKDEPCSFCYFEDNPIIRIAGCGCRTCFTCFSSFTSLSTGADQLRRCARTGWVGVTCPAHSTTSVITDPSLYKLCETSSFLRFNRFALQIAAQELNGRDCSDPRCSGIPTVSNITGNKTECSTCREWSCGVCNCFLRNCQCETWPNPTPRDHYVRSTAELITRRAQVYSSDRVEKRDVTMLLRFGHISVAVTLSTADPKWYADCRRQICGAQGAMTAEQWEVSFARTRADAETSRFFVLFHGVPLDTSRMLGLYPVYDGAIVYAVVYTDLLSSKSLPSERDLFGFRVAIRAAGDGKKPESVASAEKGLYKRCPVCNKPVVHYFNHGCHHIGFASGKCCGHHWCYVCRGPYPCKKCPLMCNPHCGCPPCPDCKPSMPCGNCWGCQQCRGVNVGDGGHEALAIGVLDMFD